MKCRWCDWQPIVLRKDGQPRQDIQDQIVHHARSEHPDKYSALAESRRAAETENTHREIEAFRIRKGAIGSKAGRL